MKNIFNKYFLADISRYVSLCLRSEYPVFVMFSVTDKCNASCEACFNKGKVLSCDKLNIYEIEKLTKNSPSIPFLNITGGEPFILENLKDILDLFCKNNKTKWINISTNGAFTDVTCSTLEPVLKNYPDTIFKVQISLDAIGEMHDKMRNCNGLFDRAVLTIKNLCLLKQNYKNLVVDVATVFSHHNQYNIFDLIDFVDKDFGVNHIILYPREANASSNKAFTNKYMRVIDYVNRRKKRYGYLEQIIDRVRYGAVLDRFKNGTYYPCIALNKMLLLNSDGTVEPCESSRFRFKSHPLVNVRDYDYNLEKLLKDSTAGIIRSNIHSVKCNCTTEACITASVLSNPFASLKLFAGNLYDKKSS